MSASVFSFGKEQFNRIFPFYVLVNGDSQIVSFGSSIAKMHAIRPDDKFSEVFQLKLPKSGPGDFESLKRLAGQAVVLDFIGSDTNSLRGQ